MSMLAVLFIILPAALCVAGEAPAAQEEDASHEAKHHGAFSHWMDRVWHAFGSWVIKQHAGVAAGCFLVIFGLAWGLNYVYTSIDLLKLFDPSTRS